MIENKVEVLQVFRDVVPSDTPLPRKNDETTPIEWCVKPLKGYLIDPKMELHMQIQVRRIDGTNTVAVKFADDKLGLINYILQTFWKSAEVFINQKSLGIDNNFAYGAYLQALRDYSAEARDGLLAQSGWYGDMPNGHQSFQNTNKPWKNRCDLLENSPIVDLYGPFMLNIPSMTGMPALPDNVQLDIKMHRNNNKFILHGDRDEAIAFEVSLIKAGLCIKRLRVSESTDLFKSVASELKAKINCFETRHHVIPACQSTASFEVWDAVLPKRLTLTFLNQNGLSGNYKENPFRLRDAGLTRIYLMVNNKDQLPSTPYELNVTNNQVARVFCESMEALGGCVQSKKIVTPEEYKAGYFMVSWNLCIDNNPGPFGCKQPYGNLRVIAEFGAQLADPMVALCMFEVDRTIHIRKDGTTLVE